MDRHLDREHRAGPRRVARLRVRPGRRDRARACDSGEDPAHGLPAVTYRAVDRSCGGRLRAVSRAGGDEGCLRRRGPGDLARRPDREQARRGAS
ncbi:MAG: hypothetical protein ACK559_03750, partial [bacterium]